MTMLDKKDVASTFGTYDKIEKINEVVKHEATIKSSVEVEDMFKKLRWKLAENHASN